AGCAARAATNASRRARSRGPIKSAASGAPSVGRLRVPAQPAASATSNNAVARVTDDAAVQDTAGARDDRVPWAVSEALLDGARAVSASCVAVGHSNYHARRVRRRARGASGSERRSPLETGVPRVHT